ncbi:MAG TPA: DUF1080 domain-containing protein [Opitutaceae bacterium]
MPAVVCLLVAIMPACAADPAGEETSAAWASLFSGTDLAGWDSYLGPRYNVEKKEFVGEPVGLNNDPDGVFSVVDVDGAPAIRITGEVWGCLASHDEFENYHLRVQYKWGEKRWPPRFDSRRDSGVLYHSVGPHAAGWFFWMRSQEFQVQEHDTGDYWAVGGTSIKSHVRAEVNGDKTDYVHAPEGELTVFRSGATAGGRIRHSAEADRLNGEWNTLDLYCLGQTSMHVVNGVLVNVLRESEQPDGNGGWIPLTKGKIQLQSEGAEVCYRDITIEPIDTFPNFVVQPQE